MTRESEGENRLLMLQIQEQRLHFWEKAQFRKPKTCLPPGRGLPQGSSCMTQSWCLEKVLLTSSLNPTPFPVFSKNSGLQLMFPTICDISGYLTQHPLARQEPPFNVYPLFWTECHRVHHLELSSGWAETRGTAASLSPTLPCQKETRNLEAGPLPASLLILSLRTKHRSHYVQTAIILSHFGGEFQCYPKECGWRGREGEQVQGPSFPLLVLIPMSPCYEPRLASLSSRYKLCLCV